MTSSDQHLLDKLSFWHKLEFFIPFDLKSRAAEQDNFKKIWRNYQDPSALQFTTPPRGKEVAAYTLFLGVFDKSEVNGIVPEQSDCSDRDKLENEQGTDLEGETCMASIALSADGTPVFEDFQVSTLPWAIGRSREKGVSSLSSDAFDVARERLKKELRNFSARRQEKHRIVDGEEVVDLSLAPGEVDDLIDLLSEWSGFRPAQEHPAALLEVRFQKKKPTKPNTETDTADE